MGRVPAQPGRRLRGASGDRARVDEVSDLAGLSEVDRDLFRRRAFLTRYALED